MFAKIIVDVPAFQTDIPYSYAIPTHLKETLVEGMRVKVPFGNGNRLVTGFVVGFEEESINQTYKVKSIQEILDIEPVINEEMMALSDYMKDSTFSFKVSCLQTMLPSMLKMSYDKYFTPNSEDVLPYFEGKETLAFREAEKSGKLNLFKRLREKGEVTLHYVVESKETIKVERIAKRLMSPPQLEEEKQKIRSNAKVQHALLDFLIQTSEEIPVSKLTRMGISSSTIKTAEEKQWLEIEKRRVNRNPFEGREIKASQALHLNDEQRVAKEAIVHSMHQREDKIFLLEGVTGSGKTEVYLQVIAECLAKGKTAMMLVPEIALTPQMSLRFKSRFGEKVAVLHSGLSHGEKYDEYKRVENGEAKVVVGARSAVFAPLKNIGVLIIDEEHESVYKQDKNPRYHARDIAIWRGKYHHCPVVLGSATPSLESRARAQKKVYEFLSLSKRASQGAILPTVEIVDLRKEFGQGGDAIFTQRLLNELQQTIEKGEQAILLLNRRGFSSFMMCRDCGEVLNCKNCDISLTLHMDTKTMRCHYCGHEEQIPQNCPSCQSKRIRYYGVGTEQAQKELEKKLPQARVLRMDVDTTRKKGQHEKILDRFEKKEANILLGTQMIAKGLDFESVTLVGVINADTGLNLPDFRASEKTFQLLTQVAGRAGRGERLGKVLIQTYNPTHYAIQLSKAQNYEMFYRKEMQMRHLGGYPPYFFTIQITTSHREENVAAKKIYEIFLRLRKTLSPEAKLLGPSPKSIARIKNQYYYQLIVKYKFESELEVTLKKILEEMQTESLSGLNISIDREPQNFV